MKNIFKFLPALAMSICFVSCDSLVDDKAVIDAKYAVQAPTLQISNLKADDYSTVSFSYTISSVEGLAVVGLEVAENSNFNNSSFFELSEFSTSGSGSISGLAPSTQYYARLYACTPDNMSVSESAQVTTPSVPLTASLLADKIYKGTFADYWGDEYNFEISKEKLESLDNTIVVSLKTDKEINEDKKLETKIKLEENKKAKEAFEIDNDVLNDSYDDEDEYTYEEERLSDYDEKYMDEKSKFDLQKANPIVYSHGEYFTLGEKLGKFGYSVKKK